MMNSDLEQTGPTGNDEVSTFTVDPVVMPCPRLEFRWHKIGDTWYKRECSYSLVLPLDERDIRHVDVEGNPTDL